MTIPTASSQSHRARSLRASRRRGSARVGACTLACAVALLVAPVAGTAQSNGGGAALLQLRPRVGDVIRMRLDQQVEVTGTTRRGASDTSMTVRTDLLLLTRSTIQRTDAAGATVLAETDSVLIFTTGTAGDWIDQTQRQLRQQRIRMHLAPDGGTTVLDDGETGERELSAMMSQMPATLPREAVEVGDSWTRVMGIPLAGGAESRVAAELKATFRLDSLGRNGELAYISMRGTIRPEPGDARDDHGLHADLAGTVTGTIVVDRRRGWMTDAHTIMQLRSTLVPQTKGGQPMRFHMKVRQWLRAL